MISLIPDGVGSILEPTPGLGNIVSRLNNYDVMAPEDYFLLEKQRFDCIIMNPPFSSKYAFMDNAPNEYDGKGMRLGYHILRDCMEMSDNIIALMPWFTISDSDKRLHTLKSWGIVSITSLPRKTFKYARIQTIILQMKRGFKEDTSFKTFNF